MELLDWLNKYASLISAGVTLAVLIATLRYVVLTGRMVTEMKTAREEARQPYLVATLVPIGRDGAKVRIQNVGDGPAVAVSVEISFEPPGELTTQKGWLPTLMSNSFEDYNPVKGKVPNVRELAARHEQLVVNLKWRNRDNLEMSRPYPFELKTIVAGWYESGQMVAPATISTQLGEIKDELSKISTVLQSADSSKLFAAEIEAARLRNSPVGRVWNWLAALIGWSDREQ